MFKVIQSILILSHGNAEVESGFSVNKNILQPNLAEKSLVAKKRLIHQAICQSKGSINIIINKEMKLAVRLSARRSQYLKDSERNSAEEHARRISEKRKVQDIKNLQDKNKKLECDCEAAKRHIDEGNFIMLYFLFESQFVIFFSSLLSNFVIQLSFLISV